MLATPPPLTQTIHTPFAMSKRTLYTVVTPLPATITRATAVAVLHDHAEMIQLNPLVINHERSSSAANAPPDEFHATWYTLTDRISYLPGVKGKVSYKACFHDLPNGLQTHVYAPAGLEIKEKWSIGGNEPGERREVLELGLFGVPRDGLYLREDVDMTCSIFLTSFVKKNLRKAHSVLVDRLVVKADLEEDRRVRSEYSSRLPSLSSSFEPSLRSRSSVASGSTDPPTSGSRRMSLAEFLIAERKAAQPVSPLLGIRTGSVRMPSNPLAARSAGIVPNAPKLHRRPSKIAPVYQLPDSTLPSLHHQQKGELFPPAMYPPPSHAPPPTPYGHRAPYPIPMNKTGSVMAANTTKSLSSFCSQPVIIAELPADEADMPPYECQQSWHEEQIWQYLDNHHLSGGVHGISLAEMDTPTPGSDANTVIALGEQWPLPATGSQSHSRQATPREHYHSPILGHFAAGNGVVVDGVMDARTRTPSVAYSMSIYDDGGEPDQQRKSAHTSPALGEGQMPMVPPVPVRALARVRAEVM